MARPKNLKRQQSQQAATAREAKRCKINTDEKPAQKIESAKKPEGRRIFSIVAMERALNLSAEHGRLCSGGSLEIQKEIRDGLFTTLKVLCTKCSKVFNLQNDCNDCSLPPNEAGVWAANSAGTGFAVMEHSMTLLEIPFMSKKKFIERERIFHQELKLVTEKLIAENGREERRRAMELGWIDDDGIVYTEVEGDCAWSKRSYSNQGTSLGGSAVLIGVLTRKVLFIATRNKCCYVCKVYGENHPHQCFKNWSGTSSGMEPSMIKEGFEKSVEMHNMRYRRYIGDGDSSVYNEIQAIYCNKENNFTTVEKVECKNHMIRCMNKNLRKLLGQKLYLVDHRKLLADIVHRIGKACVYSIAYHCDNTPLSNHNTLRLDIENILDHSIGDHQNCKQHFCKNGIIQVPKRYSKQTLLLESNVAAKKASDDKYMVLKNSPLYNECKRIIDRIAQNCKSLILGRTTNLSENHFSQFAKFLQGKRVNSLQAGSYERKSMQTFLANMYGVGWYAPAIKMVTGSSPSQIIENRYLRGLREREQNRTYTKNNKRRPRGKALLNPTTVPKYFSHIRIFSEDNDYGPNALKPDMLSANLDEEIVRYLNTKMVHNATEQWKVHLETVNQYENMNYIHRKSSMITASVAGKLFGLRDSTPNVKWLDKVLHDYPKFHGNADTMWGKKKESVAIQKYENVYNCKVEKAGLFVSLENPVLGASPDGLVSDDGLLEVKCPAKEKYMLPINVLDRKKNGYLKQNKDGKMCLKENHEYFYQVTMQLHVTQRSWCDFLIWTQGPLNEQGEPLKPEGHILVDRIFRDQTLNTWELLKSKLERFGKEDLLPEIVDSRLDRNLGYRQPFYRAEKIREQVAKKKEKMAVVKVLGNQPT